MQGGGTGTGYLFVPFRSRCQIQRCYWVETTSIPEASYDPNRLSPERTHIHEIRGDAKYNSGGNEASMVWGAQPQSMAHWAGHFPMRFVSIDRPPNVPPTRSRPLM